MQPTSDETSFAQENNPSVMSPATGQLDVSVSPSFYPGAFDEISDLTFRSSDSVLFYIHSHIITAVQPNAFRTLKGAPLTNMIYREIIINVAETSDVLAVMLHALYDTPCSPKPSFQSIVTALDRMRMYEISPSIQVTPQSNLYKLILSFAPVVPLEVYALASLQMLNDLAVESSSHLVSYPLSGITEGMAARIGPSYLLRLFQWRLHREHEMNRIVSKQLDAHPASPQCPEERQRRLTVIWADISTKIAQEDVTDLTLSFLRSIAEPHVEKLECELCKEIIENRIREVIVEWNTVPRTISPTV